MVPVDIVAKCQTAFRQTGKWVLNNYKVGGGRGLGWAGKKKAGSALTNCG